MNRGVFERFAGSTLGVALTVWILRIVVGAVFMVSGISKAIDIYGFIYKIEEYLAVWGMSEPRSLVVIVAMVLSCSEFVLGLVLAVGAFKRVAVWLLLASMAVMLPLTAYIWIDNPVSDCGCFGDFIVLSNSTTFIKNIIISAMLIVLLKYNRHVKGVYHAYTQWLVVSCCAIYALTVSLYGFNIQPLVDFRSFPPGSKIESLEDEDENFEYIYEKDGVERSFSLEALPDSTWMFVERRSLSDVETKDLTELNIYDDSGNNVTSEVIATEGEQMIIVIPQYERADISVSYIINELQQYMSKSGGAIIELISADGDKLEDWKDRSMANLPIYMAEETTLKELSRGDMSAIYVKNGVIEWKRTLGSIDVDELVRSQRSLESYATDGIRIFRLMTIALLALLAVVYMLDSGRRIFRGFRGCQLYLKRKSVDRGEDKG